MNRVLQRPPKKKIYQSVLADTQPASVSKANKLANKKTQKYQALLVHVHFKNISTSSNPNDPQELVALSEAVDVLIIHQHHINCNAPSSKYLIGSGQAQQLKTFLQNTSEQLKPNLVIFNQSLTASQERSLSQLLDCQVIDRIRLILDIFAKRARSYEGSLQVELAQLNHLSTRLVRGWTHLERQRGGIGLRGPGETQLETDRRLLSVRVKSLKKQLTKVRKQRQLSRHARQKKAIPCIAIVGYTNAGKSTLFNTLCNEQVFAHDQLFATLDTHTRRIHLTGTGACLIIDTVGFIQNLPTTLIDAFRATLEEVLAANLLIHLVDGSDPQYAPKMAAVNNTLTQIHAQHIPSLSVINKVDQISPTQQQQLQQLGFHLQISAQQSRSINTLKHAIAEKISGQHQHYQLHLHGDYHKLRAQLFQIGNIVTERHQPDGSLHLHIQCSADHIHSLKHHPAIQKMISLDEAVVELG